MLHSLVPAYAQVALDDRYGLLHSREELDLIVVDQDLDKDRHIWTKVLGEERTEFGHLQFLLELIAGKRHMFMTDITTPRCYDHAVWG